MFDITTLKMEVGQKGDDGVTHIVITPEDLYPPILDRIQECLEGEMPVELFALKEQGGTARADLLMENARKLPEQAWTDALLPRSEFIDVPYFAVVERNGGVRQEVLDVIDPKVRPAVVRMVERGYALEIALGWFHQAMRLKYGAMNILISRDDTYKL